MTQDAIRDDLKLAKLAAKHGVHHRMIAAWKRQTIEGMSAMFSGAGDTTRTASDAEVEKLPIEIERLLVDRIFSEGLWSVGVAQKQAWVDYTHHDRLAGI